MRNGIQKEITFCLEGKKKRYIIVKGSTRWQHLSGGSEVGGNP